MTSKGKIGMKEHERQEQRGRKFWCRGRAAAQEEWLSHELLHKIHLWGLLWQTHQIMCMLWKLQEVHNDRRGLLRQTQT